MKLPYTYISCPCTDITTVSVSHPDNNADGEEENQETTFDPRSPRANFSLYPIEHLFYCEDCQQIRCPRCTIEEIACWYCPNCLFEVSSMSAKSDGNRCLRNCFNCPICTAPLNPNNIHPEGDAMAGPYVLACEYCSWSTLEIGIKFDRPTRLNEKIAAQKEEIKAKRIAERGQAAIQDRPSMTDPEETFANLKKFMSLQISSATTANPLLTPGGGYNYDSPSSLARIMSLYTGLGSYGKKTTSKARPMRESADASEGLRVLDLQSDMAAIQYLPEQGYQGVTSPDQRANQRFALRNLEDLLPIPTLLRTKRSKRCRTCRHILAKPEAKVASTRYRMRLIALNYIPTITLKPLAPPTSTSTSQTLAFGLHHLPALKANQFLLTLKNPLFDPLKVTLATPSHTPGRFSHKVTVLCPQFDIGANTDAWDEALASGDPTRRSSKTLPSSKPSKNDGESTRAAEAGKVWDKGRNWTTVVLEVVCEALDRGEKAEDEDMLEIPVFVRMEYEAELEKHGVSASAEKEKEKRELAYWAVIGAGRIAPVGG